MNDIERFEAKYKKDPVTGCWVWTAQRDIGYGRFWVGNRLFGTRKKLWAHRFSYEHHKGPILTGLVLDHLCRNPACENPDHLEAVTQKVNVQRGLVMGNTWCRGRQYIGGNYKSGVNHPKAKLTATQVLAIRNDTRTLQEIGRQYGVTAMVVSLIKRRKTYRDVV